MGRLENQVAIITGAASGIGEGTVRKYVSEGARVVIADIQDERGGALAEELGPGTTYIRTDVSEEEQVAAAVGQAVSKWGRLDVMFNNAGFGGVSGNIEDLDMAAYDSTMAVLLRAVFAGSKHAVRQMKAQGSGCIINTASIAGLQAGFGPVTYSAAKAAVSPNRMITHAASESSSVRASQSTGDTIPRPTIAPAARSTAPPAARPR